MQKCRRRTTGDPAIAVGGTGDDAFEQAQDAAHRGHVVQRGDEVHLGGTGVGEAHVDAGVDQRREERTGAVHDVARWSPAPSTRSGARMPIGSKACLIARINSRAAGSAISRKYGIFSVPRPCSPEMAPPASTAIRKISRVRALRFSTSGWNTA